MSMVAPAWPRYWVCHWRSWSRRSRGGTRPMASDLTFATWLRDRLGEQNLSGATLARRLGVNEGTVFPWLRGSRQPLGSSIPPLAEVLGVTSEALRRAL